MRNRLKHRIKMIKIEFRYHMKIFKNNNISKKYKIKHLVSAITRRCENYECAGGWAYIQHSNCAYVDELSNYNYCCEECHERIDERYQEMWDEYNSSRY